MKVAAVKNDKTVDALARRLLKESPSTLPSSELAASLLRLNPHLSRIDALEEGTPILLPPELASSDDVSASEAGASAPLIEEAARALKALRTELEKSGTEAGEEIAQAQTWLKGEQGKQVLRDVPELKEEFSKTASAATELRKEQAALLTGQVKLLAKLQAELGNFLTPTAPSPSPNRTKRNERKNRTEN